MLPGSCYKQSRRLALSPLSHSLFLAHTLSPSLSLPESTDTRKHFRTANLHWQDRATGGHCVLDTQGEYRCCN